MFSDSFEPRHIQVFRRKSLDRRRGAHLSTYRALLCGTGTTLVHWDESRTEVLGGRSAKKQFFFFFEQKKTLYSVKAMVFWGWFFFEYVYHVRLMCVSLVYQPPTFINGYMACYFWLDQCVRASIQVYHVFVWCSLMLLIF